MDIGVSNHHVFIATYFFFSVCIKANNFPLLQAILFLILLRIIVVNGYPSGAPGTACISMTPGHPGAPRTDTAPYNITTRGRTFLPGTSIEGNYIDISADTYLYCQIVFLDL